MTWLPKPWPGRVGDAGPAAAAGAGRAGGGAGSGAVAPQVGVTDPDRLAEVAWCPACGVIGPPDAQFLPHTRGCRYPRLEHADRMTAIRWRRERKRDGWYAEDVNWLVGEVDRLRHLEEQGREVADEAEADLEREAEDHTATIQEANRLRDLLARLEWPETLPGAGPWHVCPVCCNHRDEGHEDDCWLGAALGKHEDAAPKDGVS